MLVRKGDHPNTRLFQAGEFLIVLLDAARTSTESWGPSTVVVAIANQNCNPKVVNVSISLIISMTFIYMGL